MSEWVFTLFFPIIGTICSNVMYSSSILVLRLSRRQRFLGKSINPIPWAFGALTSFTWFIYGVMVSDLYIISANAIGVLVGLFACSTAFILLGSAREEEELKYSANMEAIMLGGASIWIVLAYIMVATGDEALGTFLVGIFATCTSIAMYCAPMSSIPTVFRLKDASSIYAPQVIANGVNAGCWAIYGLFGVGDVFVWAPNVVGVVVSVFMLILRAIFPSSVAVVLLKEEETLNTIAKDIKDPAVPTEDPDRIRGVSNASSRSFHSNSTKYRGRLASMDAGSVMTPNSAENGVSTRMGAMAFVDRKGMITRAPSSRQIRSASTGEDSNGPDGTARTARGRVATVQAAIEIQTGEPLPPPPSILSKLQDTMGTAVEVVRARAESVFQRLEDSLLTTLEPILGVEVVEAASNLQMLYQEMDEGAVGSSTTGGMGGGENEMTPVRNRATSDGSAGSLGGYKGGTTVAEPPLSTIYERESVNISPLPEESEHIDEV